MQIAEAFGKRKIINSSMAAFMHLEKGFAGAAEKAGFETEDLQNYLKEIRMEVRGY